MKRTKKGQVARAYYVFPFLSSRSQSGERVRGTWRPEAFRHPRWKSDQQDLQRGICPIEQESTNRWQLMPGRVVDEGDQKFPGALCFRQPGPEPRHCAPVAAP